MIPVVRRTLATVTAATLAVGFAPLLGMPAAQAGIAAVSPSTGINTDPAARLEITRDQTPTDVPFSPATDEVWLVWPGNTALDQQCGDPIVQPQGGEQVVSDTDTLYVDCNLRGMAPGSYDVEVRHTPLEDVDVKADAFTIFGGSPTLTALSTPTRGRNSSTTGVTLTGTNLSRGAVVEFFSGGVKDTAITWTTTATAADMKTLTGTLVVGPTAVLGAHTVRVTTTDTGAVELANGLTVNPAPVVTSYFPDGVGQGAQNKVVDVAGTGFQNFPTAKFAGGAATEGNVTLGAVTYVSDTLVRVVVSATDAATTGTRNVTFTNPDGGQVTAALKVNPRPTITTASPAARGQGSLTQTIVVAGTNFVQTAGQQSVFTIDNPQGITIDATVINSATQATLTITVPPTAMTGGRNMTVTNFDGGKSTTNNALTINAAPQITAISPSSKARGSSGQVTVTGSGFSNSGGNPTLDFGPGIAVSGLIFDSANQVRVTLGIANDAAQGPRNVKATNPDAGTSTCSGCFSVDGLGVTGVTPTGSLNGGQRVITISGSGFSDTGSAPTVLLTRDPVLASQPVIQATNVTVSGGGTQITATVDLTLAAPGSYKIRVTNNNGDTGLCTCAFTVASAAPTATSVSPNTRVQGAQDQTLTITGTSFSNGSTVTFEQPGIVVQSTTVDSPTTITVVVDISPTASTTLGDVTVTLANNVTGTCNDCFKVSASPTVTSLNPASRAKGSTGSIVVTGTNFVSGATVAFGNPKVTVNGAPTFVSATQLSVNVTIASDAAAGPTSVTVTNPDTGSGSCASCFSVNATPTATSVTPDKGGVGKSTNVTIAGTGFAAGNVNVSAGPDIVATNALRISETAVTATLVVGQTAAQTLRDVVVTLGDGGQATCTGCFRVVSSPTVTAVSPASRAQGTTGSVTVTGTGFTATGGNPTLTFSGTGLSTSNVVVVSPTSMTANLTIDPAAATGARSLTVTNADGGNGVCNPCFTVNAGPTVTSVTPATAGRGRSGVQVTISGEGFAANAEPLFGTGITVVGTPTVTVNPSAADTIAATINVAPDAPAGGRQIGVRNPGDGATGLCPTNCFTVTAGRILVVEVFDTKGTAATNDDVLTDTPVSGKAYRVRVTAKTAEDPNGTTDTAFTGPIALTLAEDGAFVPGACADAVEGVAACTDVKFGDLGLGLLVARGSGDNADRIGALDVLTDPPALEFTVTPPTSAVTGQTLSFTFRPTVGLAGADRSGYLGTGTLELTGTGPSTADGTDLDCDDVTCEFDLSWSEAGTKTLQVVDDSTLPAVTPVVTVTVIDVGIYKPLSPARILDTRRTNDGEPFSTALGANRSIDLQVSGRNGVPVNGAVAVVVNVTVTQPSGTSYLTVWPQGEARPTASTLNFVKGQTVANLAVLKLGQNGKVSIYNQANSTHAVIDVVGYYTDDAETAGGRLVAVPPSRVFDTSFGSRIGQNSSVAATVLGTGGVPASDVTAVVVSVTAVRPTGSGYLTVYPDGEARPLASTVNFPGNRTVANLAYAKVGSNGKIRVYNALGTTHVTLDVLGYVTKTGTDSLGQFVSLAPRRILDTRGGTGGLPGRVNGNQTITPKVVGIPAAGLPATGVSAVVVNVTVTQTTGTSHLTLYPTGITRPNTSNVQWVAGQTTANLAVVKVGPDGRIAIWNKTGAAHVVLDVVGYMTT